MIANGYYGKVPLSRDFVFQNLPMRSMDPLADLMAVWVAACKKTGNPDWPAICLGSPVWRFAIAGGLLGQPSWIGLLAGSADMVGRIFPFAVMMSVEINPAVCQPVQPMNNVLDIAEERLRAFINGQINRFELVAFLDKTGRQLRQTVQSAGQCARQNGLVLPHGDDHAVCFSDPDAALTGFKSAYSWPASGPVKDRQPICLWWHNGTRQRVGDFCVTRGLPSVDNAAPYLLGDWIGHNWTPSCRRRPCSEDIPMRPKGKQ